MTKRAYFYPVVILAILLAMLFAENIRLETKLPSDGWSRSYNFKAESSTLAKPFIQNNSVFFSEDKQIAEITCKDAMECTKTIKAKIAVPGNAEIWVKDNTVVYQDDTNLFVMKNGKTSQVVADVTYVRTGENHVLYWKEQNLFELNPSTTKSKLVSTFDHPIADISFFNNSFVTAVEMDRGKFRLTYFEANGNSYKTSPLPDITFTDNESLEGFKYSRQGNSLSFMLNTMRLSQGNKAYNLLEFTQALNDDQKTPELHKVELADYQTGISLANPRNMNFRQTQSGGELLFTAYGSRFSKYEGYNLYTAEKVESTWKAKRVSTTKDLPVQPFWLGNDKIMWTNFSGKVNTLHGASSNKEAIQKSEKITTEDLKFAASNTVSGGFGSFIILLFTMLWIVLPCIYFGVLFFVKGNLFEDETKGWIILIPILLFTISQLYTFNTSFRKESYIFAPDYLTFQGSFIVWPVIIALISWGILKISKIKEVNPAGKFFYFAVVDTLIIVLLIGPYVL
ncbi:hypothetical protein JOC77_002817 [Peribacillus deserti]|uniref:Yip1 domain-containing protein n=1 Tax=Peribacillus deserti TaxID=673318 RepID=A0ABS2QJM8_9BACI|nr:hypothetical protein [Peribacillus deserti]MBM7693377.1 hypothetical protein [Peribacillus deserti]